MYKKEMNKLLVILMLLTACTKEKCKDVILDIELNKTYTAENDGVLTISNNDICLLHSYDADGIEITSPPYDTCECQIKFSLIIVAKGVTTYDVRKGSEIRLQRNDYLNYNSATDITTQSVCDNDVTATLKMRKCDE